MDVDSVISPSDATAWNVFDEHTNSPVQRTAAATWSNGVANVLKTMLSKNRATEIPFQKKMWPILYEFVLLYTHFETYCMKPIQYPTEIEMSYH